MNVKKVSVPQTGNHFLNIGRAVDDVKFLGVCFRPLDGESFSKHVDTHGNPAMYAGFRPLDGESFSKHERMIILKPESIRWFPSPRRGIIF